MDTNRFAEDGIMTEERMIAELNTLCSYYEDMGAEARLLPVDENRPLPVVVGLLTDDDGNTRVLSHSFLPLGQDDAEFSMFLQSYAELPLPEKKIDRTILLEGLNALNAVMPMGTCSLIRSGPEQKEMVAVRWTGPYSAFDEIDQGSFCEGLFLLDTSCELVSIVLDDLAAGSSVTEAMARVQGA